MYIHYSKNVIQYRQDALTTSWEVIAKIFSIDDLGALQNECAAKMEKAIDNQGLEFVNVFALLRETIEV